MITLKHAVFAAALVVAATGPALAEEKHGGAGHQQFKGDRTVIGTVEEVRSNELKVNTGEVEPRYLPLKQGADKGQTFKPGDKVEITLNAENLLVDYHLAGQGGRHRVVKGHLADKLVIGHDQALIETKEGKKEEYEVRSQVRSKMAALKTGEEAEFLIDESNKIADVNISKETAGHMSADIARQPIKGAHKRVDVTVVSPLDHDRITVRTGDGKESKYEVRPLVKDKLSKVEKGQPITLLLDTEGKVIDVAFTPKG
jgi:hypothetical protein